MGYFIQNQITHTAQQGYFIQNQITYSAQQGVFYSEPNNLYRTAGGISFRTK